MLENEGHEGFGYEQQPEELRLSQERNMVLYMAGNVTLPSDDRALFFQKGQHSAQLGVSPAGSGVGMVDHGVERLGKASAFLFLCLEARKRQQDKDKTHTQHFTCSSKNRLQHGTAELGQGHQGWQEERDGTEGNTAGKSAEPAKPSLPWQWVGSIVALPQALFSP